MALNGIELVDLERSEIWRMLQEIGYLVLSNHNNEKDANHSSQILNFDKGNSVLYLVFGVICLVEKIYGHV